MLRAYDFSKYKGAGSMSWTNSLNQKENEIAKRLVSRLQMQFQAETADPAAAQTVSDPSGKSCVSCACTVCGSDHTEVFFQKWGVVYYRCQSCGSIYVKAGQEILDTYKKDEELIRLRISKEYQEEESRNRAIVWEELVDWVKFRSFRYIGKNRNLKVIDYGNRYKGLADKLLSSGMCREYELRDSILSVDQGTRIEKADIVLYFNQLQQSLHPLEDLKEAYEALQDHGLLFFSTRIGTGFDILTLRAEAKIFPYEHVLLPSYEGLQRMLKETGFKMLEYSTPGRKDMEYVCEHKESIDPGNIFLRHMVEHGDETTFSDFQRFLQKSGLSSHAQIVAKKESKRFTQTVKQQERGE